MERTPVMVFISNLRTLDDLTRLYPPEWHERVRAARIHPGYIASPPFDIAGRAVGYLVLMLRSGREVMDDTGAAKALVLEMTRYAAETLDADVIGLGSLTTSVTRGGRDVAAFIDERGWRLRATHGDSGSVAAIVECLDVAGARDDERIGIVGAYGIIGSALVGHLSGRGHALICCGPRQDKLEELGRTTRFGAVPELTTDIRRMAAASCVIAVTSHTSALLSPDIVRPGAVVLDPAVPANTRCDAGWSADHIVIANASQVRIPGVGVSSSMFGTFAEPDGCPTSYACFAETMANALFQDGRHHVGEVEAGFVELTRRRFAVLGFRHALPRMFGEDAKARLVKRALAGARNGR